jgi:hypothetical protein
MADLVWRKNPKLLRDVALTPKKEPNILDLFKAPGRDADRAVIFSLLVQDPQLSQVMNASKSLVVRYTCWNVHKQLFSKVIETLPISAKDVGSAKGNYVGNLFILSVNMTIAIILFQGHPSALWIACYKGSEHIVRHILSMFNDIIRDEPSPDGTSACAIALAKRHFKIVELFLRLNIGQSRSLNNAAEKEREKSLEKQVAMMDLG